MEEPPLLSESTPAPAPPPPGTSLAARLLNVFAMPGEVFQEVKTSRFHAGNWLVPSLLLALVGALWAAAFFAQPSVQQPLLERQQKLSAQEVKRGMLSQADADRMLKLYSNPAVLSTGAALFVALASVVRVFWWGFLLWLVGRWFLKVRFPFLKALEVAGLALMIGVLGTFVWLLLMVNWGQLLATSSLTQAVAGFDAAGNGQLLFAATNLFFLWQIGVTGIGLAKLAGVPFPRAVVLVFALWCLQMLLLLLLGAGGIALP